MRKRTAILISGRGSNLVSLIEAASAPDFPAEIALVVSNRPDAAGLVRARSAGIATVTVDHTQYATRMAFEAKLHVALLEHRIDLVCLAGFMRMLTGRFVDRWQDRMLNIHPSLLPAFPGLDTHQRVLDQGVLITGCTVHFVRVELDAGPIIAQAAVRVLPGDTAEALGARVLAAEHRLYPHALKLVASGDARVEPGRVITSAINQGAPLFSPPL